MVAILSNGRVSAAHVGVALTAVFLMDAWSPIGVTAGALYLVPVVLCLWIERPVAGLFAAAAVSAAIALGFALRPGPAGADGPSRGLTAAAAWAVAGLLHRYKVGERSRQLVANELVTANQDYSRLLRISDGALTAVGGTERYGAWLETVAAAVGANRVALYLAGPDGFTLDAAAGAPVEPQLERRAAEAAGKLPTEEADRIAIPVRTEDQTHGAIVVTWPHAVPPARHRRRLLSVLAGRLALGLTQSRTTAQRDAALRRLEALADNLQGGAIYQVRIAVDGTYRFLHISRGIESILNVSCESILENAETLFDRILPEDRPLVAAADAAARATGRFECTVRHRTPAGELRWFNLRSRGRTLDNGAIVADGVIVDVTGLKEAEARLAAAEERSRLAIDAARFGAWDWDVATGAVIWNRYHYELLGYPADTGHAHLGLFQSRVHPADVAGLNAALAVARDDRTHYQHEFRVVWPDGSVHWLSGYGTFLYEADGRPSRMVGVIHDVTDKKLNEFDLRSTAERLTMASRMARLVVWDYNLETKRLTVDETFRRVTGFDPPEYPFQDPAEMVWIHPDDRPKVAAAQSRCLKTGDDLFVEYRGVGPEHRTFLAHGRLLVGPDGTPSRLVGVTQDVTAHRRHERELQSLSREMLKTIEAERRAIARELHDEVGQVLTAVTLSIQALQGRCPPDVAGTLEDATAVVAEAIRQVRHIALKLRPATLDDFGLPAALDMLARAPGTPVAVRIADTFPRLPAEIETTLFRIAQEAITNARRHARASGIEVRLDAADRWVKLTVRDDGLGFDPTQSPGDRLGLVGMRERVQLLGGRFEVRSAPEAGTEVQVALCLAL